MIKLHKSSDSLVITDAFLGLEYATSALCRYLAEVPSNPSYILSVGTAVAVSENLRVGNVVVGGACFRIDTPIKDDENHIYNKYYQANNRLVYVANYGLGEKDGFKVYGGNCMSADFSLISKNDRQNALTLFNKKYFELAYPHLNESSTGIYICGDMEAAAIAVIAERHDIPFIAVKGISYAGGSLAGDAAEVNKKRAAHNATIITKGILERLERSGQYE